jgi:hypothetical protein
MEARSLSNARSVFIDWRDLNAERQLAGGLP